MKPFEQSTVAGLFKAAIADGGRRPSLSTIEWDISADCSNSVRRVLAARPAAPHGQHDVVIKPGSAIPLHVDMDVRCRKCPECLQFRRRLWAAKALHEFQKAERTWLGTFTLRPEEHLEILNRLRHEYAEYQIDFDSLTPAEIFKARHKRCSRFLTLWLKRVRKNSRATLRYLLVAEKHKSALPHYHALIHEPLEQEAVTKSVLEEAWPHGFTNFKLVPKDDKFGATYACKYLSKDVLARVRASQHYGSLSQPLR